MEFVKYFVILMCAFNVWLIEDIHGKENEDISRKHRDVIFIILDDLRPALGAYGDRKAVTPNIDALAANGFVFENAFAQVNGNQY